MTAARAHTSTPGRAPRTTVVLGRLLGVLFLLCFVTGMYSHVLQSPPQWLPLFPRPAGLYQVTQGTHVLAGIVAVPLLLAKLWSVFPRLFIWPPITGVLSVLERASVAVLVGAALFEVVTGVMNIAQWYVFGFSFRRVHFVVALVLIGSILLHIAIKLPVIAKHWRSSRDAAERDDDDHYGDADHHDDAERAEMVSRRGVLIAVGVASSALLLTTAGQTVAPLAPFAVLAPRRPGVGPQGLPINRTAQEAGVLPAARDTEWKLQLTAGEASVALTLDDLRRLPQRTVDLPIACVEGWSQWATWTGVPIGELLTQVGAPAGSAVRITSLQTRGAFASTTMQGEYTADASTLVALALGGEPLDIDHGYPARVIAPGRPGVLQTKWLSSIEVIA